MRIHILSRVVTSIVFLAIFFYLQTGLALAADVVEIRLWAGKGASADNRVVRIEPHCCCSGDIAITRLSKLPHPGSKDPLEPEVVLELSGKGNILRRWPLPVDLIVTAIKGDQILVPLAPMLGSKSDRGLFISTEGDLFLTVIPLRVPKPVSYTCPIIKEFGESAYLRCFEFRDLSSGEVRRLAFQGPCT